MHYTLTELRYPSFRATGLHRTHPQSFDGLWSIFRCRSTRQCLDFGLLHCRAMASSLWWKGMADITGPKIFSFAIFMPSSTSADTVGLTKYPRVKS